MLKSLLSTSSLNILNIGIISLTILATDINTTTANDNSYSPSIELLTRNGSKRNMIEADYMQPIFGHDNDLGIVDLKLKLDNKKSKEINLGLVYRHNFEDKFIFGIYNYLDYRRTGNGFSVAGITPGVELLTKFVDFRANYYLPQHKSKKIRHNNKKQVRIQGTSIYAVSGGHTYEYALKGYDIEAGISPSAFSEDFNDKFGTKLFAAKYNFHNKNTKKISGNRFRLEQKLGRIQLNDNSLHFTFNAETQFDKLRKRQNFFGLGVKFVFNEKTYNTGLKSRMMDRVIRDVDIVTETQTSAQEISNFMHDDRIIKNIYYVGSSNSHYKGDGTKENPFSIEQLKHLDISESVIVVTNIDRAKGGTDISSTEYTRLKLLPQVVNGKTEITLISQAKDKVTVLIGGNYFVSMTSTDTKNIEIINSSTNQSATSDMILTESVVENMSHIIFGPRFAGGVGAGGGAVANDLFSGLAELFDDSSARVDSGSAINSDIDSDSDSGIGSDVDSDSEVDNNLAADQLNIFDSNIDRNNLTLSDRAIYDIISSIKDLIPTVGSEYDLREKEYDAVKALQAANPALNKHEIDNLINADNTLTTVSKTRMREFNQAIFGFDGNATIRNADMVAHANAFQNVGLEGTEPKDITSVASLNRLKDIYGLIDNDAALHLTKKIIRMIVREKLPHSTNDTVIDIMRNSHNTPPSTRYENANLEYQRLMIPVFGETTDQKNARLAQAHAQKRILHEEIELSHSSVNEFMAAYRALDRIERTHTPNHEGVAGDFYTEKVTGRFNTLEALGYSLKAITDTREIRHLLSESGIPITAENIYKQQKENLQKLAKNLGDSQRGNNRNNDLMLDDGRDDSPICAHGTCMRIIDATVMKHRAVEINDYSPANFYNEFIQTVKAKVDVLAPAVKQEILTFKQDVDMDEVEVAYDGGAFGQFNEKFIFTADIEVPAAYSNILNEVALDLKKRYQFMNPDPKLQLVKKSQALGAIKMFDQIPLN